jgi:hypothetical protein
MFYRPLEKQEPITLAEFINLYNLDTFKVDGAIKTSTHTPYTRNEEGELVPDGEATTIGYRIFLNDTNGLAITELNPYMKNIITDMSYCEIDGEKRVLIKISTEIKE